MKSRLQLPTPDEDAEIQRGIERNPDAAPDLSLSPPGILRRIGRPPQADRKVSVTLRLDSEILERFKAAGRGWQTRMNAALKASIGK